MKIYQIHEYGGHWEDRFDCIISSYISEEKAIAEKEKLEKEQEDFIKQSEKCSECPLYNRNKNITDVKKYCNDYEPFDVGLYDADEYDESDLCVNYVRYCSYWDYSFYRIEEVEVIE